MVPASIGGSSFTAPASGLYSSSVVKDPSIAAFTEVAKEFEDSTVAGEESASKDFSGVTPDVVGRSNVIFVPKVDQKKSSTLSRFGV